MSRTLVWKLLSLPNLTRTHHSSFSKKLNLSTRKTTFGSLFLVYYWNQKTRLQILLWIIPEYGTFRAVCLILSICVHWIFLEMLALRFRFFKLLHWVFGSALVTDRTVVTTGIRSYVILLRLRLLFDTFLDFVLYTLLMSWIFGTAVLITYLSVLFLHSSSP